MIPPASSVGESATNPSPYAALLGPVVLGDELVAVIEVFQRPGASPGAQQGYLQFLAAVCELATEYERNRELQSLQDKAAVWGLFEDFMLRLLGANDRRSLAFAVRFRVPDRTLTDADVATLRQQAIDAVVAAHDAELRG